MPTNSEEMSGSHNQLRALGAGLILAIGAYGVGQIVVLVTAAIFMVAGINIRSQPSLLLGVSVVMLQGVTFGGVALAYLSYKDLGLEFIHARLPSLRDIGLTIGGFGALLGALWSISMVISALGLQSAQNTIVDIGSRNPVVFLLLIPLSFLLIGPGEELLYRGLIQGILRETFHPARAIVLASALFAVVHVFSLRGEGKLVYLGVVFVLALILGGLYEYTDNLVVPALVHGGYNATLFGIQYLTATGGLPT
ncbi:CPBP family intramembrane glutamic endopeptidase [Haladaptatus halobius]|uniref:CPBP family intramembrane glutamic endopeptidase n=1 Tax=Haladaptatus halobius TaxID=2884875 RepID=UPI001D0AACC5|nr:type II CAAX endopeptidase family protein [Haladaptatus halobius]